MPTGELLSVQTSRGVIRAASDQKKLDFDVAEWMEAERRLSGEFIGWTVSYEEETRGKKIRAIRVRPISAPPVAPSGPRLRPAQPTPPRRDFLNPYNFVRPVPEEGMLDDSTPEARLLGRCPPPPHDRYVGLSGVIDCSITTRSEVFVSDSHHVSRDENRHGSYRFFRRSLKRVEHPCIPGSTLRGVVRSLFEAVTNSCWELVEAQRLYRRYSDEAQEFVPGRVVRQSDGTWSFEMLTGTTTFNLAGPGKAGGRQYAAWVRRKGGAHPGNALVYGPRPKADAPPDLRHGERVWAHLCKVTRPPKGKQKEIHLWNVVKVERAKVAPKPRSGASGVASGYYFAMGWDADRKHDERFFFRATIDPAGTLSDTAPACATLPVDVLKRYVALLQNQRENVVRNPVPGISMSWNVEHGPRREGECAGHLCYARIEKDGSGFRVLSLGPVSMPRQPYVSTLRQRFPALSSVVPCSERAWADPAHDLVLCPACRVFGWVRRGPVRTDDERFRPPSYRGRLRFGDAVFQPDDLDSNPRTLAILSSPKPTTTRFYLIRKSEIFADDRALKPVNDKGSDSGRNIDYDQPEMALRGRKLYRVHRPDTSSPSPEASNQNRTIVDHLGKDATATFEVRFASLAPVELGALLWTLELPEGLVHRLGYGKPLGYGAVRIDVKDVRFSHGVAPIAPAILPSNVSRKPVRLIASLRETFEIALARRYGYAKFDEVENVSDLRALLDATALDEGGGMPVHYPKFVHPPGYVVPEGHAWFMVNRMNPRLDLPDTGGVFTPMKIDGGLGYWLGVAECDPGLPDDPRVPPPST